MTENLLQILKYTNALSAMLWFTLDLMPVHTTNLNQSFRYENVLFEM